ncbi:Superoxide dismutase [Mn] [Astathelohania contejeani]|uniref:Superoxide dismutase n=1 Tax=Astathelohania contejeani TaxID=164912 RepID=A0ABQ7HXD5_9MICR|nr:Superoxide dismutase [Mn] [Thelohania contejeani]
MNFTLPSLPYEYSQLEPYIDAQTVEIHHSKHHKTYLDKLNTTLETSGVFKSTSIEDIIMGISDLSSDSTTKTALRNYAGGYYNHTLYWYCMGPESNTSDIMIELKEKIESDFGSFENMKKEFNDKAADVFGSGYAWLCYNKKGNEIVVCKSTNQDNPIMDDPNLFPFMTLDVWEHAYYLKFQNRRVEYINTWWNVVDWKNVSLFYNEFAKNGMPIRLTNDGNINIFKM